MTTARAACDHCGLEIATTRLVVAERGRFCCSGCMVAFDLITDSGLEGYYALRERVAPGESSRPARVSRRDFGELEDEGLIARNTHELPGGLRRARLHLEGMHCAACVWLLERVGQIMPGIESIRIDYGRALAEVTWDPASISLATVAQRIDRLGYTPHLERAGSREQAARREDRAMLLRTAVAGAIAANVMILAVALYGDTTGDMESGHRLLFRWTSLVLATPSALWCGAVFFRGAMAALSARTLHMDLPIALGIAAGYVGGAINTLRDAGEIYFDSVTMLVFLLLAGRLLERRQQRRAGAAADLLLALHPRRARVVEGESTREVAPDSLAPGAVVEVRPGEVLPADGVVNTGESTLDLSLFSGESVPVEVAPGAACHAGAVNLSGVLRIAVGATGGDTRIGRIAHEVEVQALTRPRVVRSADRLARAFVGTVILLAAAAATIWSFLDPSRALDCTMAVLVVACPCALGLATPLAVAVATGRAARLGALVKSGDVFEQLAHPGVLWLDKTGTVTHGSLAIAEWQGDEGARHLVAALEARSLHPVARALARAAEGTEPTVDAIEELPGRGIRATVGGHQVVAGAPAFVLDERDGQMAERAVTLAARGLTPVVIAIDGTATALVGLADPLREDAAGTIVELMNLGWRVGLLSGDHSAVVARIGDALHLPPEMVLGEHSPENKLEVIEGSRSGEIAKGRTVVMAGDGVNDAIALAAADVGIAVGGGAEAAQSAADVAMTRSGIEPVADLIELSRRTVTLIRSNLLLSLIYNVVGVGLAISGLLGPLAAAVLMPISSLTVVARSLRLGLDR